MQKIAVLISIATTLLLTHSANAQIPITTGLRLHLDAAIGYNPNGASASTWADQSGSGNNMTSGAGTQEPVFVSNVLGTGFPGIQFDGTNDYMVNTLNSTFFDSLGTLFVVRIGPNTTGLSGGFRSMISIAQDQSFTNEMCLGADWGLHHSFSGNWTYKTHPCFDSLPVNKPVVLSTILGRNINDITYALNGNYTTTSISTVGSPVAYTQVNRRIIIGARYQNGPTIGEYYQGHLLEIVAYNRKLSNAEFDTVNNYLVRKYNSLTGITLTGDTICNGEQAYLTYTHTGGPATATISYNDGTTTYTRTVTNGVPFAHVPSPTSNKTYTLGASISAFCSSVSNPAIASANVTVNPTPIASAGSDTSVCSAATVTLKGVGGGTYQWYAGTVSNPNIATPTTTIFATTTYRLRVSNSFACADSDDVLVTVLPNPIANAGNDTTICRNKTVTLKGSGGGTYLWTSSGNITNPTSANPAVTPANTTNYQLIVTNTSNCSDTDDVTVIVTPTPVADAGIDTAICTGGTVVLNGSGGGTYLWYGGTIAIPSIASPIVKPNATTTYFLVVSNTFACSDTDDVQVIVNNDTKASIIPTNANLCVGSTITLTAAGGTSYFWYPPVGLSDTDVNMITATPIVGSNNYYVVVTDSICKIKDTLSARINVADYPIVSLTKSNDLGCNNNTTTITATGADTYGWATSGNIINTTSSSIKIISNTRTTVTVTGTGLYGCTDTSMIDIDFSNEGIGNVIIPTAFSPNGDGTNDCFKVITQLSPTYFDMMIYNRWGNKVFSSNNISNCWDGQYMGEIQTGTYYYYLRFKTLNCGEIIRKGDITIVR